MGYNGPMVQLPVKQPQDDFASSQLAMVRQRCHRQRWLLGAFKLLLVFLFVFLTGGTSVLAQYDESNPGVYWRQERARQQQIHQNRARRNRVIIQRPTRLIRRARPRRGYTRAIPDTQQTAPTRPLAPQTPAAQTPATPTPGTGTGNPALAIPAAPNATPPVGHNPSDQAGAPAPTATGNAITKPAAAPPTAGAQKPATIVQPAPVMRVAVFGDNLASQLARGLAATYADTPQIEIIGLAKDNSGLVRQDYYDWNEEIKKVLASGQKFDIAIMMVGSNDRQSIRDASGVHAPRSEQWNTIYTARIAAIAAQFRAKKIPLIWLGMPVMRLERLSVDMLAFNQLYRDVIQKHEAKFVDIWEGFLDERSRFTLYGPDVNGEIVKLRVSDGVHFTRAGARKLAHFAEIDIKRLIDKQRQINSGAPIATIGPVGPGAASAPATANAPGAAKPGPGIQASLPKPAAPPKIVIPVKPIAGPVVELTAPPLSPGGTLATRVRPASKPVNGPQANVPGQPQKALPGRADDFRWPRP